MSEGDTSRINDSPAGRWTVWLTLTSLACMIGLEFIADLKVHTSLRCSTEGTTRTYTDGRNETGRLRNRAISFRSSLEILYAETDGGDLKHWAWMQAQRLYPNFPDDYLNIGTPSIAHDPKTNNTVVGFRVHPKSIVPWLTTYLMLCELRRPEMLWHCQDSGFDPFDVPRECDARYWHHPQKRVFFGMNTDGPEDARLFMDEQGNLGATAVMRGCHHGTPYGNSTALYSVYLMSSRKTNGVWNLIRYPKLLDLRGYDNKFLGENYPAITKSWVSIPSRRGHPLLDQPEIFRFSLGWTAGMKDAVVYKVKDSTSTLFSLVPTNEDLQFASLDLKHFRASTNLIEFKGALLGVGHHYDGERICQHYWYVRCADEPYKAVALSDDMCLRPNAQKGRSFALGLAMERNRTLYLSWSENDDSPFLTRYSVEDIMITLRNSTFARVRGESFEGFVDFTAMCQHGA